MGTMFHVVSADSSSMYNQELKFGKVMLKRAMRELGHLEAQVRQAHEAGQDAQHLKAQLAQLQQSIVTFEHEMNGIQFQNEMGLSAPPPLY